ncbi:hypothetical protein KO489_12370 [Reinekea forsetii]|nr:hypothetical protein [Reinekea forsetii]
MKNLKFWVPILAALVLFSCSKPGGSAGNGAPVINWILADIIDYDPEYLTANGSSTNAYSLAHLVTLDVEDPDGNDDIVDIRFTNSDNELYILKSEEGINKFNSTSEHYVISSYSSNNLHKIKLSGWTMTITDSADNVVTQDFNFVLPNLEDPATNESFLYTSMYVGDETGGVKTLKSPTFGTHSKTTTEISIQYTPVDPRTKGYRIVFYDSADNRVAYTNRDTTTPQNETYDVQTTYTITNNSITYLDGKSFDDIAKFSWSSYDDAQATTAVVPTVEDWWRHEAHSALDEL